MGSRVPGALSDAQKAAKKNSAEWYQDWSIAHNIPTFWYGNCDENNHRLNTEANLGCDYEVGGYGEKANRSKSIALPGDEEMLEQEKNCWPVEWMGMLPSKWFRNAKIAKHREEQKRVFSKATKDP